MAKLFPELHQDRFGHFSDGLSKWFTRFIEKAGAKADKISFHSFRHTYRDGLRETGISPERVKALGGWTRNGEVHETYGSSFKASTLAREIAKVKFDGLDLSHLYPDPE